MADSRLPGERHSVAADAELIRDSFKKAEAEALNGLRQYDLAVRMATDGIELGNSYRLRISHILALHREALTGISSFAGNFRPAGVSIEGSDHEPVDAHLVPELVEELCDYVNANWTVATAIHLSAYVMWRLNWIHPFSDGNGRTSRALSFTVLSIRSGVVFAGTPSIPDQIVDNRNPHFEALDSADAAWRTGTIDVSRMESLVETLLARQLKQLFEQAGGKTTDER